MNRVKDFKSLLSAAKKEAPEPNVHVNTRGGFISVNGVKL